MLTLSFSASSFLCPPIWFVGFDWSIPLGSWWKTNLFSIEWRARVYIFVHLTHCPINQINICASKYFHFVRQLLFFPYPFPINSTFWVSSLFYALECEQPNNFNFKSMCFCVFFFFFFIWTLIKCVRNVKQRCVEKCVTFWLFSWSLFIAILHTRLSIYLLWVHDVVLP